MSILSKVTDLLGKEASAARHEGAPDLPRATSAYTLGARTDGDYDVLDGVVLVGSLSKDMGDGDHLTTWKVHVRDVDASFDSLESAKAWLAHGHKGS